MGALSIDDILGRSGLTDIAGEHALRRQDIHGCQYTMRTGLSEPAASFLAQYYNDLGHHQSYWAEIPTEKSGEFLPPVPLL